MLGAYLYRVPELLASGNTITGAATFTGDGTFTVGTPQTVLTSALAVTGRGTLSVTATRVIQASASFIGDALLNVDADVIPATGVVFSGDGAFNANALRVANASVQLGASAELIIAARVVRNATGSFTGSGFLTASPTEAPDVYTAGPCDPWDVIWPASCDLDGVPPAVTGYAVQAASEILWARTTQRFGICSVALRPCRSGCLDRGWAWQSGWWEFGQYPYPALINGAWFNLGCGSCGDSCSCTELQETKLPGPVYAITEVKVDGETLSPAAYQVQNYRKLLRIDGGLWPTCNDFTKADSEIGTWSVTAEYGEPVPMSGRIAAGELACEIVGGLTGGDCNLPAGLTQLTRQGVSMSFETVSEILRSGLLGLPMSDTFITTYNPRGIRSRPVVYNIDGNRPRQVT